MTYTLVIVESPAKCQKITEYLGSGYKVMASFGHLQELNGLKSIDIDNYYKPNYSPIQSKLKQISSLRSAINLASDVILATDDDREGEAIAKNIYEMSKLKVPIVSVVIGEGASGGALGIGVCDRMLMFENTWYSVISPEGCASILWRDASKAPEAADSMKVTAQDLVEMGICDKILKEPLGGAHRDSAEAASILKKAIIEEIAMLRKNDNISYLDSRIDRYYRMGAFNSED